jgi:hypothetical protein
MERAMGIEPTSETWEGRLYRERTWNNRNVIPTDVTAWCGTRRSVEMTHRWGCGATITSVLPTRQVIRPYWEFVSVIATFRQQSRVGVDLEEMR